MIILKLKKDEYIRLHFKNLKNLTIYGQFILDTVTVAKSAIVNKSNIQSHSYNTRVRTQILPSHRLEIYSKKNHIVVYSL